ASPLHGSGRRALKEKLHMLKRMDRRPSPRLTYEEARLIWAARDAYRVERLVTGLLLWLLVPCVVALLQGRWDLALVFAGAYAGLRWGVPWLVTRCIWAVRLGGRWLKQRIWAWLPLALICVGLSSCQTLTREVAHLYGYKGDIYASPCLPESLSVGFC